MNVNKTEDALLGKSTAISGLRIFLWAYLVKGFFSFLATLFSNILPGLQILSMSSLSINDGFWSNIDFRRLFFSADMSVGALAVALGVFGLWKYFSLASRHNVGGFARGALVGLLVSGLCRVILLVFWYSVDPAESILESTFATISPWASLIMVVGECTSLLLLTLVIGEVNRKTTGSAYKSPAVMLFVLLGISVILRIYWSIEVQSGFISGFGWPLLELKTTLDLFVLAILFFILQQHLTHLIPDSVPAETTERFQETQWLVVRSGLRIYRTGLIAKLVVAVIWLVIMLPIPGIILYWIYFKVPISITALGTTVWMMLGLYKYARAPRESGGRSSVVLTYVVMGVGLLLEMYLLFINLRLIDAGHQTFYILGYAQMLWLLSLLTIIFSFRQMGNYAGSEAIFSRLIMLPISLIGVALSAQFITQRLALAHEKGVLWPAMIVVVVALIFVVRIYLRQLHNLYNSIGDSCFHVSASVNRHG